MGYFPFSFAFLSLSPFAIISGFRRGQRGYVPPKKAKSRLFALHMQCNTKGFFGEIMEKVEYYYYYAFLIYLR